MQKFKILTLLGIRPDYIRMAKLIKLLDKSPEIEHILVHSGQHYDPELFGNFLDELSIRHPNFDLKIGQSLKSLNKSGHAYQLALLTERTFELLERIKPNLVLFLGDTNTVLASMVVARSGFPVAHIEAGGRSFDWRMPEEKNRITIDHLSDALYCYLERYQNLLIDEGVDPFRISVIGNIIHDPIVDYHAQIDYSKILQKLELKTKKFILFTLHREENLEDSAGLKEKLEKLLTFAKNLNLPIVWPIMPRTQQKLQEHRLEELLRNSHFITTKPLGFFEFLSLESHARIIASDSGTVQEEALILGTPCAILRKSTERPETIWAKATILQGNHDVLATLEAAYHLPTHWNKNLLNPLGGSPSEKIHQDILVKHSTNFFTTSRTLPAQQHQEKVREAYNI